jgi:hypothetical protein
MVSPTPPSLLHRIFIGNAEWDKDPKNRRAGLAAGIVSGGAIAVLREFFFRPKMVVLPGPGETATILEHLSHSRECLCVCMCLVMGVGGGGLASPLCTCLQTGVRVRVLVLERVRVGMAVRVRRGGGDILCPGA